MATPVLAEAVVQLTRAILGYPFARLPHSA